MCRQTQGILVTDVWLQGVGHFPCEIDQGLFLMVDTLAPSFGYLPDLPYRALALQVVQTEFWTD